MERQAAKAAAMAESETARQVLRVGLRWADRHLPADACAAPRPARASCAGKQSSGSGGSSRGGRWRIGASRSSACLGMAHPPASFSL